VPMAGSWVPASRDGPYKSRRRIWPCWLDAACGKVPICASREPSRRLTGSPSPPPQLPGIFGFFRTAGCCRKNLKFRVVALLLAFTLVYHPSWVLRSLSGVFFSTHELRMGSFSLLFPRTVASLPHFLPPSYLMFVLVSSPPAGGPRVPPFREITGFFFPLCCRQSWEPFGFLAAHWNSSSRLLLRALHQICPEYECPGGGVFGDLFPPTVL